MKYTKHVTSELHINPDELRIKLGLIGKITSIRFDNPNKYNKLEEPTVRIIVEQEYD